MKPLLVSVSSFSSLVRPKTLGKLGAMHSECGKGGESWGKQRSRDMADFK